jgi:hypothetical protein
VQQQCFLAAWPHFGMAELINPFIPLTLAGVGCSAAQQHPPAALHCNTQLMQTNPLLTSSLQAIPNSNSSTALQQHKPQQQPHLRHYS